MTEFFMPMIPPTSTKQARGWHQTADGKVISYDRANANAEGKLTAHLAKHIPPTPYTGAIRLIVKWMFPLKGKHYDGEWYTNKPDYDNLPKAMNDIMTKLGYWKDDCIIASGITEKFWSATPGIYVRIEELKPNAAPVKKRTDVTIADIQNGTRTDALASWTGCSSGTRGAAASAELERSDVCGHFGGQAKPRTAGAGAQ